MLVSDQVMACIESSGLTQGPPLLDHPAPLWIQSSSPSRLASLHAWAMASCHWGDMKGTLPAGTPCSTLKICAPPRPIRFIASRSAVIPSLLMLPLFQCHHVCGLARSGGLRNPASREAWAEAMEPRKIAERQERKRLLCRMKITCGEVTSGEFYWTISLRALDNTSWSCGLPTVMRM